MEELVARLALGEHPVTVGGPIPSLAEFQKRVTGMEYVFIKFTDTRGGTDLDVCIDKETTDLSRANFAQMHGIAHVEGTLILDYIPVRCVADIDLATLNGSGHLEVQP
ncbi:MbtH domain protein [Ktedonosporobacter rubrisoli]|uniref:MbtH domain protein n=1 Tax=Ktedonosporobacter rubrisoli TaxID=2509675 RepID=A0A4V0YYL4_KTERU|nr:MbtH domain protein [Ktedonosporobacter rubrisoli]QBD76631.1 MbtH domain protein [Ktedonosporobacter rubrisoli]